MKQFKKNLEKELSKCTLCNRCISVCPTFQITGDLKYSPKGRIDLAKGIFENYYLLSETKEKIDFQVFSSCLNCFKCSDICPVSVDVFKIVNSIKNYPNFKREHFFLSFIQKKIAHYFYTNEYRQEYFFKILGLFLNNKLFNSIPRIKKSNAGPFSKIAKHNFFKKNLRYAPKAQIYKKKVILFLGIRSKFFNPEIAEKAVKILRDNQIEVYIPRSQLSSSYFLYTAGYYKDAKKSALRNVLIFRRFRDADAIITLDEISNYMLKNYDNLYGTKHQISLPIYDIMDYLIKEKAPLNVSFRNQKIAYYLNNAKGEAEGIQNFIGSKYLHNYLVLKNLAGVGSFRVFFNYSNDQQEQDFLDQIAGAILESKAEIVASSCLESLILMSKEEKLSRIKFVHTLDLFSV